MLALSRIGMVAAIGPIGSLASYETIRSTLPGMDPAPRKLAV